MPEEFTRGCYGGLLGAGVWTQYGQALAAPVGRIHWAGAETSDVWNGYLDGAVRSGRRRNPCQHQLRSGGPGESPPGRRRVHPGRRVGMPILAMDFVECPSRRPPRTTFTGMSRFPPWRRSSRPGSRCCGSRAGRSAGTCWPTRRKRVLRIHRVTTAAGALGPSPGRLSALTLLPRIPARAAVRLQVQRPRTTWSYWGTGPAIR